MKAIAILLLAAVLEYPVPTVREEQSVTVNGVAEMWQLHWKSTPKPVCEPSDISLTCPCTGFAYGEGGDLELGRLRGRITFDHLLLTPLFGESPGGKPMAIIQRWAPDREKDFKASLDNSEFGDTVRKRPTVQVMRFADYDHDGESTEFYLPTETVSCGHTYGIVIGVSKANPRLHAFGTASHPGKPLYMQKEEWQALRDASGPVDVVDWQCDDHGSEEQIVLHLYRTAAGIDGRRRHYACTTDGKPGKLIGDEPL